MKFGFVLEGGAMRAVYTAGVLDVLYEAGIQPEGIIGTSAGAIHSTSYLSGQPGRTIRYYKKYSRDKHFMSFYSLLTTGSIVGEKFCYHDIPDQLDPFDYDAFAASGIPCYMVSTALKTGKPAYFQCKDLHSEMDYMRASASMPLVSRIVTINGEPYLDGGVADSIPDEALRNMGYTHNLVVLTQCEGYQKKPMKLGAAKIRYRKYPAFIEAMGNRHRIYNEQVAQVEKRTKEGTVFLIRPSEDLKIGRMETDPDRLEAQYNLGRKDTLNALPALQEWLEKAKKE